MTLTSQIDPGWSSRATGYDPLHITINYIFVKEDIQPEFSQDK